MTDLASTLRALPTVLLHDHLDGGLRPATVLELAAQTGYDDLPADDADALATFFRTAAHSGSLERYLEPFAHTVGVMQHRDAIERVAFECAQDLAADGVVYAEVRFAPELHTEEGLTLDEVVQAVLDGFARGAAGTDLTIYAIATAMRTAARLEAMITDPVYEGKSMAGTIDLVSRGEIERSANVLYAHLGGQPAINAYASLFI